MSLRCYYIIYRLYSLGECTEFIKLLEVRVHIDSLHAFAIYFDQMRIYNGTCIQIEKFSPFKSPKIQIFIFKMNTRAPT